MILKFSLSKVGNFHVDDWNKLDKYKLGVKTTVDENIWIIWLQTIPVETADSKLQFLTNI